MLNKNDIASAIAAVLVLILFVLAAMVVWACGRPRGHAGGAGCDVSWPAMECVSEDTIAATLRAADRIGPHYGPPTAAERAELESAAAEVGVRPEQLEQIRRMERALAAGRAGTRAQRVGDRLARDFAAGGDIVELAAKYRLPPMCALRQVLIERGLDPRRPPAEFADAARAAAEADLGSAHHAAAIRAGADAFEARVADRLRELGLRFETEADLRRRGVADATPDFLLAAPVRINGRPVHWIDAKNYMMYGSRLVARSLQRQAAKYTARFGPGAMVFAGGVRCGAAVGDTLLLAL
jgi:hypothetical protein